MDNTEGSVSESDPANMSGIVQGSLANPMGESASVDSFGITIDVPAQEAVTRLEKPWSLVRVGRCRGMATNGNVYNPKNVIFHLGNSEQLHKFVLNKSLLIFSSLWFCKILEESLAASGICTVKDVATQHFECIVHYLLGHFTWEFTTMENACEQIETANRFELKGFNDELFETLARLIITKKANFNNEVVCRAWVLFTTLDSNDLLENSARGYILKNATNILRGDKFLDLSSERLLDVFTADELVVDSELDVYKALLRWGVHNLKQKSEPITTINMRKILLSLFPAVRFFNMSRSEIRNYVLTLQLLLPEQTQCLKDWCSRLTIKPEDHAKYSNDPRNYNGKIEVMQDHETDEKSQLERLEAEALLARYDQDNSTHNFKLEILKIKQEMAKDILDVKRIIGNTNGNLGRTNEELNQANEKLNQAIEGDNHTKVELNQTKEKLNQAIEGQNHTKEELNQTKEKLNQAIKGQNRTKEELNQTKEKLNQAIKVQNRTKEELNQIKQKLIQAIEAQNHTKREILLLYLILFIISVTLIIADYT